MVHFKFRTICLIGALLLALPILIRAQAQPLNPGETVSTSVAAGETAIFTFDAIIGSVWSVRVEGSEGFDPVIELRDRDGRSILTSDDYAPSLGKAALLEAITVPRTDVYTVAVTSFDGGAGEFMITLLPGFGERAYTDDFGVTEWIAVGSDAGIEQEGAALSLDVSGARVVGDALNEDAPQLADLYAQVGVEVENSSGWSVGINIRQQGDSFYRFAVNYQGLWRFTHVDDGEERVIRDWTPHPNIVAGTSQFVLGILARGNGFDFFYNSAFIGEAADDALTEPGYVGLTAATVANTISTTTAVFRDLIVTQPVAVEDVYIVPQQVITSNDPRAMVQSLQRNHVVGSLGDLALTVPESSVEFARPGINRVGIGRGVQFENFALAATVTLTPLDPTGEAGCGLIFRETSDTEYVLAFFNQIGEYGLSERSGDLFTPGLYGVRPDLGVGQHHLLIIADESTLYFYVDGYFVGSQPSTPVTGEIGIAVVNFEPNTTTCTYSNLWLWRY